MPRSTANHRSGTARRAQSPADASPLGIERRTLVVLAFLLFGMSVVYGALRLLEPGMAAPLQSLTLMSVERTPTLRPEDRLFAVGETTGGGLSAVEPWQVIVIHDSQRLTGSYDSLNSSHVAEGKEGCGYHFVINNGSQAEDGRIEVGYRWKYQKRGDFFSGPEADSFNQRFRTIGICLVGDLDRQPLTPAQGRELQWLVQQLQQRFDIGTDRVFIDVGSDGDGVGDFFPHAAFRDTLSQSFRLAGG